MVSDHLSVLQNVSSITGENLELLSWEKGKLGANNCGQNEP